MCHTNNSVYPHCHLVRLLGTESYLFRGADHETVRRSQQFRVVASVARRYQGKGMGPWEEYLRGRGWSGRPGQMDVFMDGGGVGVGAKERVWLLVVYAMHLKERGRDPKTYFQALAHSFTGNLVRYPTWGRSC